MNAAFALPGFHEAPLTRIASCADHGDFTARCYFKDMWTSCPGCSQERKQAEAAEEDAKVKAAAVQRWQQRLGMAGIPERFQNRALTSYIAKSDQQFKALEFATQYANEFDKVMDAGRCAVFVGKPGTGKTHLAVGIALAVMERWNGSALFTTTLRAIRRVKDTWTKGSKETESEAIAALVFPDLLVLDEVGIQFGSDTEKLILFDVLNERYEQRKPTLLLSNLTTAEVQGYLGERILDRLREDGGQVVVFDWPSHRGSASANGGEQ